MSWLRTKVCACNAYPRSIRTHGKQSKLTQTCAIHTHAYAHPHPPPNNGKCSSLCRTAYVKTNKGQYCPSGADIVTETECRAAAKALGLKFGEAWTGKNDHKYCLLAEDGRDIVYFNLAQPKNARPTPKDNYSSLCKGRVSISLALGLRLGDSNRLAVYSLG